jgi:hypothetical protein
VEKKILKYFKDSGKDLLEMEEKVKSTDSANKSTISKNQSNNYLAEWIFDQTPQLTFNQKYFGHIIKI